MMNVFLHSDRLGCTMINSSFCRAESDMVHLHILDQPHICIRHHWYHTFRFQNSCLSLHIHYYCPLQPNFLILVQYRQ